MNSETKTEVLRGITRRLNRLHDQLDKQLNPRPHKPPQDDFAEAFLNMMNEAAKK
ncbi:hypothetical protein [Mobiluncus porci]|uniref:hypothetical protein n=1 Tax=Mobiluncus porci TaxID=2652278 RepID=UPI0012B3E51D|nr:hypothetical protein [Mobiluncus porci]